MTASPRAVQFLVGAYAFYASRVFARGPIGLVRAPAEPSL